MLQRNLRAGGVPAPEVERLKNNRARVRGTDNGIPQVDVRFAVLGLLGLGILDDDFIISGGKNCASANGTDVR